MRLDDWIMDFAPRKHLRELVANQFTDAQLPLRSSGRLIAMMVTDHFCCQFAFVMPGLLPGTASSFFLREQSIFYQRDSDGRQQGRRPRLKRPLHGLDPIALDNVADFHVLVIFEGHAAFLPGDDFPCIVLETF